MSDTQLRIYCFEQARAVLGVASVADLLATAEQIYAFLTDTPETLH